MNNKIEQIINKSLSNKYKEIFNYSYDLMKYSFQLFVKKGIIILLLIILYSYADKNFL